MLGAIREIQPAWVVAENVYGLLAQEQGVVFERVCSDMEVEGYEVQPFIIPACAVGAPHRRERIWFIAHRTGAGVKEVQQGGVYGVYELENAAHALCNGLEYPLPSWDWDSEFEDDGWIDAFDATGRRRIQNIESVTSGQFKQNIPDWRDFPTQSPVCRRDDGFPGELDGITFPKWRSESIKASGNAIVPQVAYEFFKIIDKISR
jgi:DNA (cytosine-5)-methyltransferase 1